MTPPPAPDDAEMIAWCERTASTCGQLAAEAEERIVGRTTATETQIAARIAGKHRADAAMLRAIAARLRGGSHE